MTVTATPINNSIVDILRDIGVPANLCGYQYLTDAIELVCMAEQRLPLTRTLYPHVAKKNGTTAVNAERCMRHSIELAFTHGNADVIYSIFKNTVDPERGKATTGQFIYMIADTLMRKSRSDATKTTGGEKWALK